jgi:hypothetical protein
MKIILSVVLILFSFQSYAAACKCNCGPVSRAMCASSYDLDHPCNGMCTSQAGRTACPVVEVFNQSKNRKEWITMCTSD